VFNDPYESGDCHGQEQHAWFGYAIDLWPTLNDPYDPRMVELQDAMSTIMADWANEHPDEITVSGEERPPALRRRWVGLINAELKAQLCEIVAAWEQQHKVRARMSVLTYRPTFCPTHKMYEPYYAIHQLSDRLKNHVSDQRQCTYLAAHCLPSPLVAAFG